MKKTLFYTILLFSLPLHANTYQCLVEYNHASNEKSIEEEFKDTSILEATQNCAQLATFHLNQDQLHEYTNPTQDVTCQLVLDGTYHGMHVLADLINPLSGNADEKEITISDSLQNSFNAALHEIQKGYRHRRRYSPHSTMYYNVTLTEVDFQVTLHNTCNDKALELSLEIDKI